MGYQELHEFMACNFEGGITLVEQLHVAPAYRGNSISERMLRDFRSATFNAPYETLDAAWRANLAGWTSGDRSEEFKALGEPEDQDRIAELCGTGLMVIPKQCIAVDAGRDSNQKSSHGVDAEARVMQRLDRMVRVVGVDEWFFVETTREAGWHCRDDAVSARYKCAKCSANLVPKVQTRFGPRSDKLVAVNGAAACSGLKLECEVCELVLPVELELCEVGVGVGLEMTPTRNGRDFVDYCGSQSKCPECFDAVTADWDEERLQFEFEDEHANDYEHVERGYMRLGGHCGCKDKRSWDMLFKVKPNAAPKHESDEA